MKYDEAMAGPDKDKWKQVVKEEHEHMIKTNVFKVVTYKDVPKGSKILTSTWAMKKKASGIYHAQINARGYEQVNGEHYDASQKSAPVCVSGNNPNLFHPCNHGRMDHGDYGCEGCIRARRNVSGSTARI
jgi:hypothetical protein